MYWSTQVDAISHAKTVSDNRTSPAKVQHAAPAFEALSLVTNRARADSGITILWMAHYLLAWEFAQVSLDKISFVYYVGVWRAGCEIIASGRRSDCATVMITCKHAMMARSTLRFDSHCAGYVFAIQPAKTTDCCSSPTPKVHPWLDGVRR
jgi:hypothetical protein